MQRERPVWKLVISANAPHYHVLNEQGETVGEFHTQKAAVKFIRDNGARSEAFVPRSER